MGHHAAETQLLNLDGSCQLIHGETSPEIFQALCTHNGGEPHGPD